MPHIIKTSHFTEDATRFITQKILATIESNGSCVMCLAGGKTPAAIYAELSKAPIEWSRIFITFGDERNVPSDDPENNYRMAHETFLSRVAIPPEQILRIETERGVVAAAEDYDGRLRGLPHLFDVTLLGIGSDGHTASLFPGTAALCEKQKLAVDNNVPQLNKKRITLTYPALNSSKEIIFLINDPSKKKFLKRFGLVKIFLRLTSSP